MVIVDTSVWVDHLARQDERLCALLEEGEVLMHPMIAAELALGHLPRRTETLDALQALPRSPVAGHNEAMVFLNNERLHGLGIGYVDLHLLAAARLAPGITLWTRDKRLHRAGVKLGVAASPLH